ncbi:VWA domain-containing protein [Streptomonospora sp. S1-112]|uniref:VWA domain-containing protein n=1 Tax=Streptomonospora mangrovi TaxID=2883123 RepID=A0A9X3NK09_9ACTN|nr:VWA domain-containing protein [Streptomonospora mangrovi]MDA0563491.1 VWA domain-containing protein [Streptomonospora mangrovi]
MTFLSAGWLWLLVVLAALVAVYVLLQYRRREYTLRFTNLALLDRVAPARPGWWRHLSSALFFLTVAVLIGAMARPAMPVEVPRERATIMVAIDVSPSMAANDVDPNRLTAAKESARGFVESLPDRFNVGLVVFSATASVVSSPTQDHQAVTDSIENLQMTPGTAIGEGVFTSLQAISSFDEEAGEDPPPSAIVLLSDGENTSGRPITSASRAAADMGVPVSTIAFGTGAAIIEINGEPVEADIDKDALERLAQDTDGYFYEAESEAELTEVYDDIGSSLGSETVDREIVTHFVGIALLLAGATAVAALAFGQRVP